MAANRTALGTGVPAIDRDERPPVPAGLVLQLAEQLPPADIGDGLRQAVILQQVFNAERLDTDHLVLADESSRQLVLKITTAISDAGMDTRDLSSGFLLVLTALLFLRVATLGTRQPLLLLLEEVLIARFLPCRERHNILQPQINPNGVGRDGQGGDVLGHQEGDEIPPGGITADRDGAGFGVPGQGAAPDNGQGLLQVHQPQGAAIPAEGKGACTPPTGGPASS